MTNLGSVRPTEWERGVAARARRGKSRSRSRKGVPVGLGLGFGLGLGLGLALGLGLGLALGLGLGLGLGRRAWRVASDQRSTSSPALAAVETPLLALQSSLPGSG